MYAADVLRRIRAVAPKGVILFSIVGLPAALYFSGRFYTPPPPPPPLQGGLTADQKRDMFIRFNAAVLSKARQDDSKAKLGLMPPVSGDAHWLAMWNVLRELAVKCDDEKAPSLGPQTSSHNCHGLLTMIRLQLLSSVDEEGARQTATLLHQAMADKVVRAQVAQLEGTPEYEEFVNNPEIIAKYKEHVLAAQQAQRKNRPKNPILDDEDK